ncbi:MAG: acyl-CoA thioesterase, partial [Betaproteobacteria bacterium]
MNRNSFVVRKVVRFAHCDPAGIIFYPQYLMLAHDCKEDWFRDGVGYAFREMITRDRRGFPIVKLEADFVRPSRLGDDLAQRLRLPARPVVAMVAALQRAEALGRVWAQAAAARRMRGLGAGR